LQFSLQAPIRKLLDTSSYASNSSEMEIQFINKPFSKGYRWLQIKS